MKLTKIGEFLKRSKIPIDIEDDAEYNRVTIRINHNGVSLRDSELGKLIGTKKQFILKAGQFIVSKIDARYGAFGIAPIEVDNAIITGNFWAYDVDKSLINIDWFNQFTNSPVFYEVCERASSGITHRKYLDEKFFLNYQILLPNVDEQLIQIEKIDSQKVAFSELSSELSYQFNLVKKLRQQLLQDAVQGKLVEQNKKDEPASELLKKIKAEKEKLIAEKKIKKEKELPPIKAEDIPFEIPEGWVWCRLGEISDFISGSNFDSTDFGKGFGAKCIKITNAGVGEVIETDDVLPIEFIDKFKSYLVFEGDLILALTRPYIADGLKISKCPASYDSSLLNQRVAVIRTKNYLNQDYVYQFLRSDYVLKIYKSMFEGKGQQPNLKKEDVTELLIPILPLAEQHRIVQKLDELMQYCNDLEASIKQSESQNEKLLQQVLREALRKEPVGA